MKNSIFDVLGFHPVIKSWFLDEFSSVSPPQKKGWPSISNGKHTLILAPTGSGKTLAAFLWSIDELFRLGLEDPHFSSNPSGIHTLYISPLKALNNDIQRNLTIPLKGVNTTAPKLGFSSPEIRSMVRTGDTPPRLRQSMLKKPPHILITTPESLYLILNSERGRLIFSNLRYLILDEIHSITTNKRGVHLSLSLERLMPLCKHEPIRIGLSATQKPLDRIAEFLGGYKKDKSAYKRRLVSVIDCGQRKKMDLQVIAPVPDFTDLPDASVWPAVIKKLYDFINAHKTTLVFVNMRSQTEKIARQLNELYKDKTGDSKKEYALSHHGSMSREMRFDVEDKLKSGKIAAVIATSSLELGIDIGSIDLVVQLEAPKSVSGALQRVGRSGHLLKATSKGRIIPLYLADLDDAAAITQCMRAADIEEVVIPQNCVDVLAQQIVAEVAAQTWPRKDLYHIFKQSYCYQNLSLETFDHILQMLTGRYSESKVPALQPVISWDKVNDRLIALPGSRLLANLNGGTIPDRGYYGVYLAGTGTRLGEMEEEFVFESKVNDIFYLGNTEWRIDSIAQDRIVVTPASSVKPRAPFWKGELGYQNYVTAEKVGAFRGQLLDDIAQNRTVEDLADSYALDMQTAQNLIKFIKKQQSITNLIPTNRRVIAEWFYDTAGELNIVVHATLGGRVNAPWAIACAAELEKHLHNKIQYSYDDNGFILRFSETTEFPAIENIFQLNPENVEQLIRERLTSAPVFSIQFRYNAARSLILARSRPGKRIPLWLQRLRAADLYQAIEKYPDFPILLETYRSCLEDVFDMNGLQRTIEKINKGEIQIKIIHTPYPSPMVSGLMFNFVSNQVYEQDRLRISGDVAIVSNDLLDKVLSREKIPSIITEDIITESRNRWQNLNRETKAKNSEQLFLIIKKLGPVSEIELSKRSHGDPHEWLETLILEKRITKTQKPKKGWIAVEDLPLFENLTSEEYARKAMRRLMENEGPLEVEGIIDHLLIKESHVEKILNQLLADKEIVCGRLLYDSNKTFWCQKDNFSELYRRAIASRRKKITGVKRANYLRFLIKWHCIRNTTISMQSLIEKYEGWHYSPLFIEREIFRTRLSSPNPYDLSTQTELFDNLISQGEVIIRCLRQSQDSRKMIDIIRRGSGNLFIQSIEENKRSDLPDKDKIKVFSFLKENGASHTKDIEQGTGFSPPKLQKILGNLVQEGLVTTDSYQGFLSFLNLSHKQTKSSKVSTSRHMVRKNVQDRMLLSAGRWFLTESFAVMGNKLSPEEQIERQTRLLLLRHGILVKEWYRRENSFLPWYQIFQVLKRLEWQGEIRRGYFIEGLSGIQFALPEAIDLLQSIPDITPSPTPILVSTVDPALSFGGNISWDLKNEQGNELPIVRAAGNHLLFFEERPVLYSENYSNRLWTLGTINPQKAESIIDTLKTWLRLPVHLRPRKKITIDQINSKPAAESSLASIFLSQGFEKEDTSIILWPSGV